MERDFSELISLLGQRLQALQSLAQEISAGQQACVALDFDGLQAHDKQKERLCGEVSRIDAEMAALAGAGPRDRFAPRLAAQGAGAAHPEILRRIQRLGEESEAARVEVGRRNQIYAAFLRRARSNLNVMTNVVSHCLGVYPPWVLPASAGSLWERGY